MGFPGSPFMNHWFQNFLHEHAEPIHMNHFVVAFSIGASLAGLITAVIFYIVSPVIPEKLSRKSWVLYTASKNKLWFDEIYQNTIIKWFKALANLSFEFDTRFIDRTVNEIAAKTVWASRVKAWVDQYIVDGAVNGIGFVTRMTSSVFRFIQTGFIHNYLFVIVLGVIVILYTTVH